jgi:ketosteroid isomerase-like protein
VADGNAERIRGLYGFNWAAVDERERGLAAAADVLSPDAESHVSPELGDRTLHGVPEFAVFVMGLEQDFSEFRYEADAVHEPTADRVVVTGHVRARGRVSRMPLSAPFAHVWVLRDGKAVSVIPHHHAEEALAAARGT